MTCRDDIKWVEFDLDVEGVGATVSRRPQHDQQSSFRIPELQVGRLQMAQLAVDEPAGTDKRYDQRGAEQKSQQVIRETCGFHFLSRTGIPAGRNFFRFTKPLPSKDGQNACRTVISSSLLRKERASRFPDLKVFSRKQASCLCHS